MVDLSLFRNLRFTAASGSVTVAFFAIAGFSFLITQYFQFFKGYRPLSTGVHLLPVAVSVAIASVVGTKLAVRFGTKQVVTAGLFCLAAFFAWVSTARTGTSYLEIAGQMVLGGSSVGLISAPATEAIMGVVPTAKAGVGSAVNDATRLLGSTLGVAIIGSVYASIYASRLTAALPSALPAHLARAAHDSAGAALAVAGRLASTGHSSLAANAPPRGLTCVLRWLQRGLPRRRRRRPRRSDRRRRPAPRPPHAPHRRREPADSQRPAGARRGVNRQPST